MEPEADTHHVICDKLQVTDVNVDLVHGKDATNLPQDRSACCLNAIGAQ